MTGPRIYPDNTAVSRTPRATPGLLDLLRSLLQKGQQGAEAVEQRIASGLPEGTLRGTIPEYIEGPGGVPKIVGKAAEFTASRIPASLKRILGIENDEALTRMTKYELEDRMYRAADDLSRAKRGYGLENPADADREIEWLDRMDPNGFQRELREDYFLAKRAGKGKGGLGFDKAHEPYLGDAPSGARMREMLDKKWLKSNTP